jgi:hypothetical protein
MNAASQGTVFDDPCGVISDWLPAISPASNATGGGVDGGVG